MCEEIQETGAWVVEATVIEREGACSNDHQVGETFRFKAKGIEGALCFSSLCGMIPKVYALRYGANIPWTDDPDVVYHRCPARHKKVVYELRRVAVDPNL